MDERYIKGIEIIEKSCKKITNIVLELNFETDNLEKEIEKFCNENNIEINTQKFTKRLNNEIKLYVMNNDHNFKKDINELKKSHKNIQNFPMKLEKNKQNTYNYEIPYLFCNRVGRQYLQISNENQLNVERLSKILLEYFSDLEAKTKKKCIPLYNKINEIVNLLISTLSVNNTNNISKFEENNIDSPQSNTTSKAYVKKLSNGHSLLDENKS